MKVLDTFIAVWQKDRDIEAVLDAGIEIPSLSDTEDYLGNLNSQKRAEVLGALAEAAEALEQYTANLKQEAEVVKTEIHKTNQRSKALLIYNLSQFKNSKRT